MNGISIPALIMSGITLYAGFYQSWIYFRRGHKREDITFALTCLGVGIYDIFCAGLYSVNSVNEGVRWQRAQVVTLAFISITLLWFIYYYTSQASRITLFGFSAYFSFAAITGILERGRLIFDLEQPFIKNIFLPFGNHVTYYEATPGLLTNLQSIMGIVGFAYIFWCGFKQYRRGQKSRARPLLAAMTLFFFGVINDIAISSRLFYSIYLIEYAYLGVVLMMAYSLSREIVESAKVKYDLRESERKLYNLMSNLNGIAYRCLNDKNWTMTFVSWGCIKLTGYQPVDLINNQKIAFAHLIHPDDREVVWDAVQTALRERKHYRLVYRINTASGEEKWVWDQGVGVFSPGGEVLALEGFITDMSDRRHAEEALREAHERFLTVLDSIDAHVYVSDMQTYEILLMNAKMREDFGGNLMGNICWKVFRGGSSPCAHCSNERLVDASGNPTGIFTWEMHNPITERWYVNSDRAIRWTDGRLVRLQIAHDITERKQAEERMQYLSNHDALTNLYNRFYFDAEMDRLENSRHFPVSIVMFDVDGMKNTNDTLGHAAGDELLKRASSVFRDAFRVEDIIARIGGDEFAVILPDTDENTAQAAETRILESLSEHNRQHPDSPLEISVGMATGSIGTSLSDILRQADQCMYRDKTNKNQSK